MGFTQYPLGAPGSTPRLGGAGLSLIANVPFTAAASVSLDGCFTRNFDNYRVTLFVDSGSTTAIEVYARLRLAGTDNSSSYNNRRAVAGPSSVTVDSGPTTSFQVGYADSAQPYCSRGAFDLMFPAVASKTGWVGQYVLADTAGTFYSINTSGIHNVATAYDGFTLYSTAGNITGTLSIFGYRK